MFLPSSPASESQPPSGHLQHSCQQIAIPSGRWSEGTDMSRRKRLIRFPTHSQDLLSAPPTSQLLPPPQNLAPKARSKRHLPKPRHAPRTVRAPRTTPVRWISPWGVLDGAPVVHRGIDQLHHLLNASEVSKLRPRVSTRWGRAWVWTNRPIPSPELEQFWKTILITRFDLAVSGFDARKIRVKSSHGMACA